MAERAVLLRLRDFCIIFLLKIQKLHMNITLSILKLICFNCGTSLCKTLLFSLSQDKDNVECKSKLGLTHTATASRVTIGRMSRFKCPRSSTAWLGGGFFKTTYHKRNKVKTWERGYYPPCLRPRSFLLSNLGEEAIGPLADLVKWQCWHFHAPEVAKTWFGLLKMSMHCRHLLICTQKREIKR